MPKTILDLCGGSGAWSAPYAEAGYRVFNITLPKYDILNFKAEGDALSFPSKDDIRDNLRILKKNIYGVLAAPPCTKFSRAVWHLKKSDRNFLMGMKIVEKCLEIIYEIQYEGAPLRFWVIENPMGYLNRFLGHPPYYYQPWMFGDKTPLKTKRTYLWGYFNAPVKTKSTRDFVFINSHAKENENKLSENKEWYRMSADERAKTPRLFAEAFFKANQ